MDKTKNGPEELINWVSLSIFLTGNRTSITRNRIPKKYVDKVDGLLSILGAWTGGKSILVLSESEKELLTAKISEVKESETIEIDNLISKIKT